jgi:hypothetical protein
MKLNKIKEEILRICGSEEIPYLESKKALDDLFNELNMLE